MSSSNPLSNGQKFATFDVEQPESAAEKGESKTNIYEREDDHSSDGYEYIESSEPMPLLHVLQQSPRLRLFSYLCGVSAPSVGMSMTWYQVLLWLWAWVVRIFYTYGIISPMTVYFQKSYYEDKDTTPLTIAADMFYTFKQVVTCLVLFDICIRPRRYHTLKRDISNVIFLDINKLLQESASFIGIYAILAICYSSYLPSASLPALNFLWLFCQMLPVYFVYVVMSYEFMYMENVLQNELLLPAEKGTLTLSKFKGVRALFEAKTRSHLFSFSVYSLLTVLSCIALILYVYNFIVIHDAQPPLYLIAFVYVFVGKELIVMFLIIWKISRINEKSRSLSLLVADTKPSLEFAYIYIQNNTRPIVYKIFGLISIYETELIVSIVGYVASFVAAIVKGKGQST